MKKLAIAVAAVLVVGMVASWAASVQTVNSNLPLTIKGKISSSKTAITEKDFAPAGSSNAVVGVISYNDSVLGSNITVIGAVTTTINTNVTPNTTSTVVNASAVFGETFKDAKGKFTGILTINNAVGSSNGAVLVTGKIDDTKKTISLKAVGVWVDDKSTISASIKNAKATKSKKTKP